MNISVLFRGISYVTPGLPEHSKLINPCTNAPYGKIDVDFFNGPYDSYIEKIKEPLEAAGHKVTTYISTYNSKKFDSIKNVLNPESFILIDPDSTGPSGQPLTVREGLKLIKPCDFVLVARFDVLYKMKITEMNFDFKKINFLWREEAHWDTFGHVGDLFFGYPFKHNNDFIGACDDIIASRNLKTSNDFHYIYRSVINNIQIRNGCTPWQATDGWPWLGTYGPPLDTGGFNLEKNINFCIDVKHKTAPYANNPFLTVIRDKIDK